MYMFVYIRVCVHTHVCVCVCVLLLLLYLWHMKFPGPETDLHHSRGNACSLACCARPGIKPAPQQWPEPPQRQCWILYSQ